MPHVGAVAVQSGDDRQQDRSSSGQRTSFQAVAMTGAWPKNR
jgi:hypothetical protein